MQQHKNFSTKKHRIDRRNDNDKHHKIKSINAKIESANNSKETQSTIAIAKEKNGISAKRIDGS